MTTTNDTSNVLYCFLRALSVKVSWRTVHRLLDTPVGNSMRGISDALDALHIENAVYRLPSSPDFFMQLVPPFIATLHSDDYPFCVVTKRGDSIVEIGGSQRVGVDFFMRQWTGCVLVANTTSATPSEYLSRWKDITYYLWKYKEIIAFSLLIFMCLMGVWQQNGSLAPLLYSATMAVGMLASVAILHKEVFNDRFLERFCHIGQVVDCNKVLHSKGAGLLGINLGTLSMCYFATLFFFSVLFLTDFYGIATVVSIVALFFTLYSLVYQIFVVRIGCMLCMLVNVLIWISAFILYCLKEDCVFHISLWPLLSFCAIGCIMWVVESVGVDYQSERKERILLNERFSYLLNPSVFQTLLVTRPHLEEEMPFADIAVNNSLQGRPHLLIVTNPSCRNCAAVHPYIMSLAVDIPLSLVLIYSDNVGKKVVETVLSAYLKQGWETAIALLDEWYTTHKLSVTERYPITEATKAMMKEHVMFCRRQGIRKTPIAIVDGYFMPEVYSFANLKYVLGL